MTDVRIHPKSACEGHCPFHNPSDHHMKDWPILIRYSGLVERTCPHGIGHPDPDSLAYLSEQDQKGYLGIHGCDGCCAPPEEKQCNKSTES